MTTETTEAATSRLSGPLDRFRNRFGILNYESRHKVTFGCVSNNRRRLQCAPRQLESLCSSTQVRRALRRHTTTEDAPKKFYLEELNRRYKKSSNENWHKDPQERD